jgi:S-DNA-T family DNA segregation ATPase FtsK/SpoIIIE
LENLYPKPGNDPGVHAAGLAGSLNNSLGRGSKKIFPELCGLFCLFCAVLLLVSLLSFSPDDPGLNHIVSEKMPVHNWAGVFGAYLSALCIDLFGFAACLAVLFLALAGAHLVLRTAPWPWWRWSGFLLLWVSLAVISSLWGLGLGDIRTGGLLGRVLRDLSLQIFNPIGSGLVWGFVFLSVLQLSFNFSWPQTILKAVGRLRALFEDNAAGPENTSKPAEPARTGAAGTAWPRNAAEDKALVAEEEQEVLPPCLLGLDPALPGSPPDGSARPAETLKSVVPADACTVTEKPAPAAASAIGAERAQSGGRGRCKLPPLNLLQPVPSHNSAVTGAELEAKGRALMTCLADFSIQAELARISPGPVVTSFEVRPAPGVRSARIAGLSDDLALSLKAVSVRIQAPIPGTDTIGIEIPNDRREIVGLRELLESPEFNSSRPEPLLMALGKDISGRPAFADLAKMPHMLVAGATGKGKSVFLNSVLLSLLYRVQPDEVKLLIIDPKQVEMTEYADLPHLIHPIVKEPVLARNALEWAVAEMERRYDAIGRLGARNMQAYNRKLPELGASRAPALADLDFMPYLVIIIDELADLMLTAGKEVETCIVRLAQLARAAGIHLIVATQRPSVDVVTGLIKANFPCRISFQVTSKPDSRTILDSMGAERLLGMGDMLFKPGGGEMRRLHGAYAPDMEISLVADYWRAQAKPDYQVDFSEWAPEGERQGAGASAPADLSGDAQYKEIVEFVRQQGKVSISLIQRRFGIGFNKAARHVEQMEQDGIIGPANGSKPRQVM